MALLPTRALGETGMEITWVGYGSWAVGGGGWRFGWGDQDDADLAEIAAAVSRTGAGEGPVRG
jgi:aryl-alcohol dehydrogenase-like predicted oxidoreductase